MPTLDALLASRHDVVCVVSQPDRGRGRGRKRTPSPVSARALERGVPLLRPERVGDPEVVEALRRHAPDTGVVVAFGQFIPRSVRELPRLGYLINAHASLLPRHRGASPIAAAILAGDETTGVSVMRVEREMDSGAVALVRETPIGPRENTEELGRRLAGLAAEAIVESLERIAADTVTWTPQDEARVTIAPKLDKRDGRIDWREPTARLVRRIHALAPRPGAFTGLPTTAAPGPDSKNQRKEKEEPEVLRILRAEPSLRIDAPKAPPGTVYLGRGDDPHSLEIATGDGWLAATELQRSGGRAMAADALLRGFRIAPGSVLGTGRPDDEARGDDD